MFRRGKLIIIIVTNEARGTGWLRQNVQDGSEARGSSQTLGYPGHCDLHVAPGARCLLMVDVDPNNSWQLDMRARLSSPT